MPKFSLETESNNKTIISKSEISDNFIISEDKINIFNSEIYNDDSSLICDPRILFDELHSFWLIDMIESLCDSFAACVNDEKTVIVLDNSPGYVGLGKAIHDWLTDIGPDCGKFLTISSLDVQDLNSCLNAIQAIENIVEQKFEGAKYYHQLKKNIEKIIEEHCIRQQQIMRENGLDERLIRATASHGYGITVDIEPLHEMEKVLYAVDELTGLIGAVAIMRPSKSVMDLEVPSVRKKYTYTFHRYLGYFMG